MQALLLEILLIFPQVRTRRCRRHTQPTTTAAARVVTVKRLWRRESIANAVGACAMGSWLYGCMREREQEEASGGVLGSACQDLVIKL